MDLTVIVLLVTSLFLALYDIYIISKKGKSKSISAYVIRGSKKYPLIVLLFGIILGHLFWSIRTESLYEEARCYKIENGKMILLEI